MTSAQTRPLRIAILGNSSPVLVMPPRARREDGTYGEQLERLLAEQGIPAEVTNHARMFELINEGGPRYRDQHMAASPDVLVISYGALEMQPNVLPTPLVRHLTRDEFSQRGIRGVWFRRGTKAVWPAARRYQRWAAGRVGMRTWRLPPKRYVAELRHVIGIVRAAHTLVLVVDILRPNDRLEHFMPGVQRRWERYQQVLRDAVSDLADPHVRLIEMSKAVDELGDAGTEDGLHLTAEAHGLVAAMLSDEIRSWATR